ncbi:MAG: DUF1080 domain-containing protein [Planctomycetaceae bacterium]
MRAPHPALCLLLVTLPAFAEEGFTPLFNGKDLSGWMSSGGSHEVVDGELRSRRGRASNVQTMRDYGDFVLKFEFKLSPGADNGLGIRMPPGGEAAYDGIEIQLVDESDPKRAGLKPEERTGSIYGVVAAKPGAAKPAGEWNAAQVTAKGSRITVAINGTEVIDADVADFRDGKKPTPDGREHPGLGAKRGPIGFLSTGTEVSFRGIEIRRLDAAK